MSKRRKINVLEKHRRTLIPTRDAPPEFEYIEPIEKPDPKNISIEDMHRVFVQMSEGIEKISQNVCRLSTHCHKEKLLFTPEAKQRRQALMTAGKGYIDAVASFNTVGEILAKLTGCEFTPAKTPELDLNRWNF